MDLQISKSHVILWRPEPIFRDGNFIPESLKFRYYPNFNFVSPAMKDKTSRTCNCESFTFSLMVTLKFLFCFNFLQQIFRVHEVRVFYFEVETLLDKLTLEFHRILRIAKQKYKEIVSFITTRRASLVGYQICTSY